MDFAALTKLTALPAGVPDGRLDDDARVHVSVRLQEGAPRPDYLFWKSQITGVDYAVNIPVSELARLEADPAVESFTIDSV